MLCIDKDNQLIAFELKSGNKLKEVNIRDLVNNEINSNDAVKVLALLPLKNKLMAVIEHKSQNKSIYIR